MSTVPEVCGLLLQYDPLGIPDPDHVQVSDGAHMGPPTRTLALQTDRQLQLHVQYRERAEVRYICYLRFQIRAIIG